MPDFTRIFAALNRTSPQLATGGAIQPARHDGDRVPYVLSPGYALVSARAAGVDHDGPVIVWDDGTWEPAVRDDLPAGFSTICYDQVARGGGSETGANTLPS